MLATADTEQTGADGWLGGNTLAARYYPDRVNSIVNDNDSHSDNAGFW
jgi:hypothetical protein